MTTATNSGVTTDVRDDASWSSSDRINLLNQIKRQDIGGNTWRFSYDANGNMTSKTNGTDTWTYTFDLENRLTRVQGPGSVDVAYVYDAAGRMMKRTSGGVTTRFTWDGMDCIRESTPSSTTTYLIPQGMLLGFIRDGVTYFVSSDALGSCRLVTDASGVVKARFDHGGYGETLATSFDNVPGGMPYSWVGSQGVRYDPESQLLYMRQRWYDPTLQRFISRDPIGLSGGENLYSYCGNNPTLRNDPMGLEPGGERDWIDEYNEAMTKWYQEHPYGRPHLEFDRGKSKEDCMKNCMKVFDLLPESWELPLQIVLSMGLPIPKSIPKALGMTGGATGPSPGRRLASSTTLGSLLAQQF